MKGTHLLITNVVTCVTFVVPLDGIRVRWELLPNAVACPTHYMRVRIWANSGRVLTMIGLEDVYAVARLAGMEDDISMFQRVFYARPRDHAWKDIWTAVEVGLDSDWSEVKLDPVRGRVRAAHDARHL